MPAAWHDPQPLNMEQSQTHRRQHGHQNPVPPLSSLPGPMADSSRESPGCCDPEFPSTATNACKAFPSSPHLRPPPRIPPVYAAEDHFWDHHKSCTLVPDRLETKPKFLTRDGVGGKRVRDGVHGSCLVVGRERVKSGSSSKLSQPFWGSRQGTSFEAFSPCRDCPRGSPPHPFGLPGSNGGGFRIAPVGRSHFLGFRSQSPGVGRAS